ncbi:MAG: hypothetical protein LPK26_04705 [Bacillaceae bacterium]|nr:hypothetical protein [Bacillaceae bacterium]
MINDFLNQDCLLVKTTRDSYGKDIKSDPIPVKCRIKEEYKLVKNQAAQEVVSHLEIWFDPYVDITFNHLIQYEDNDYRIIDIKLKRDLSGSITRKVVFC